MLRILFAAVLACVVGKSLALAADDKPFNLLVIHTDEHHYSTLGCYGGSIVKTPHIDWIADNGAKCTSFYATTPVCSPSRAALVSGLYPHKTPVTTNNIPLDDSVVTFAEVLRRQGYSTGYSGKWHLDGGGKPQWAPKRKFGFEDNRFMFNRGHWKNFEITASGPRIGARNEKGQPTYGLNDADDKSFATDWLCDRTIDFIDANADKPFCYMVSLPDPHGPNTVRAPYDTMYADVGVPIPVTLNRRPEQIPAWGQPSGVKPEQLRKLMRQYYGMVKCIDDNVGQILDTLRKHDLIDRTIIVFTADHGDLCGEHGRLNKGVPYEGSARIPFLLYCPHKVKPKTVVNAALNNIDFLPTVMSLLNVSHDRKVDGRNAAALFTQDQSVKWDDVTIVRSTGNLDRPVSGSWISAISERYKLVYSTQEEPWLIDLKNDPNEVTNIFGQGEHKDVTRWLTAKLDEYGQQHKDPYVESPRIREWMKLGRR